MNIIAHIETCFPTKFGVPRQAGIVETPGRIVFEPEYRNPDALRGLEGYSHIWLLWDFSQAHRPEGGWTPTVRPPRLGGNKRMGVFATRSPFRPNNIGLSSVRVSKIELNTPEGPVIYVEGADLMDGTPILDIKPYLPFTDCHPDAVGGYADAEAGHRLKISDPDGILPSIPDGIRQPLIDCVAEDPRPSYQDDPERVYGMAFGRVDVKFTVAESVLTVTAIRTLP